MKNKVVIRIQLKHNPLADPIKAFRNHVVHDCERGISSPQQKRADDSDRFQLFANDQFGQSLNVNGYVGILRNEIPLFLVFALPSKSP